jgi:hypothetical protein
VGISNSYVYAAKPSWFGNCPWPPFDPASPSSVAETNIPAGYRYAMGSEPVNNTTTHNILNLRIQ